MSSSEAGQAAKTALEKWLIREAGEKPPHTHVTVEQTWCRDTCYMVDLSVRLRFPQGTDDETIAEYVERLDAAWGHKQTLDGNVQRLKPLAPRESIQENDEGERDKLLYTTVRAVR